MLHGMGLTDYVPESHYAINERDKTYNSYHGTTFSVSPSRVLYSCLQRFCGLLAIIFFFNNATFLRLQAFAFGLEQTLHSALHHFPP